MALGKVTPEMVKLPSDGVGLGAGTDTTPALGVVSPVQENKFDQSKNQQAQVEVELDVQVEQLQVVLQAVGGGGGRCRIMVRVKSVKLPR